MSKIWLRDLPTRPARRKPVGQSIRCPTSEKAHAAAAYPGRSSRRETDLAKQLENTPRALVSRTERAPRQSQRVAEELLGLRLLAAVQK